MRKRKISSERQALGENPMLKSEVRGQRSEEDVGLVWDDRKATVTQICYRQYIQNIKHDFGSSLVFLIKKMVNFQIN